MSTSSIDLDLSDILTDVCSIVQDSITPDTYGQPTSTASVFVAQNIACRLLPYVSRKGGSESKTPKNDTLASYVLYMFPVPNTVINEHMWVVMNGKKYDITTAIDPVITGAPMELYLQLVKA